MDASRSQIGTGTMTPRHVTKISPDGRVTLPEETRERWGDSEVVVVDLGDHVVIGPMSDAPIRDLQEKFRGRGPSTDEMRRQERAEEAAREDQGR